MSIEQFLRNESNSFVIFCHVLCYKYVIRVALKGRTSNTTAFVSKHLNFTIVYPPRRG